LADDIEFALTVPGHELPAPAFAGEVVCARASEDFVLFGCALDTGRKTWDACTDDSLGSSPTVADGVLVVGDSFGRCYAFNAATGALRWKRSLGEEGIERAPAACSGCAYVPVADGMVYAIDIQRGKVMWEAVTGGYMSAYVSVCGDTVVASCGDRLLSIDAQTGDRRWRRRVPYTLDGGLAIRRGLVVVGGSSTVFGAQVADGTIQWQRDLDGSVGAPSVAGSVIFVATNAPNRLYALSLADGRELWSVELRCRVIGAPVPVPGRVLVTVEAGAIDVWRV
jgi:outer membrane protein assembly factor BamB